MTPGPEPLLPGWVGVEATMCSMLQCRAGTEEGKWWELGGSKDIGEGAEVVARRKTGGGADGKGGEQVAASGLGPESEPQQPLTPLNLR